MFTHKNICFIRLRNGYEKETFCKEVCVCAAVTNGYL